MGGAEIDAEAFWDAVDWASGQWSEEADQCSDMLLVRGSITDNPWIGFDWRAAAKNENLVVFRNGNKGLAYDDWIHPVGAIAITTVTFVRSDGTILDTDVELNDRDYRFSDCDPADPECDLSHDLRNTLTHEFGHILGLDHPPTSQPEARTATMFAAAPAGDVGKRTLAEDDVAGLCFLYPAGQEAGECFDIQRRKPPDVRITQQGCSQGPQGPVAAFWIGLLLLRYGRRKKPFPGQLCLKDVATEHLP
jgi:hypothetical protein